MTRIQRIVRGVRSTAAYVAASTGARVGLIGFGIALTLAGITHFTDISFFRSFADQRGGIQESFSLNESIAPAGSLVAGKNSVTFQNGVYTFTLSQGKSTLARYELNTNDRNVQRGLLRVRDAIFNFYPISNAGTWYRKGDGSFLQAIPFAELSSVSMQHQFVRRDVVRLTYTDRVERKVLQKAYELEIKGKTLVVRLVAVNPDPSSTGNYAGFMLDRVSQAPNATNIDIPYLDVSAAPITMAGTRDNRYFFSTYLDYTRSNANSWPWPVRDTAHSSEYQSFSSHYIAGQDGSYPALSDTLYITTSRDISEVMMHVHREASPYRADLNDRVVWNAWHSDVPTLDASFFQKEVDILKKFREFRMDNLWATLHVWQFKDFDCGLPEHYPARVEYGGDSVMRLLTTTARGFGYLFGFHQNYIDFYVNSKYWSGGAGVALEPNGSWRTAWYSGGNCPTNPQSYKIAPDKMASYAAPEFQQIRGQYRANASHLDVTSTIPLPQIINYAASDRSSGTFRQAFQGVLNLNRSAREAFQGPVSGEGFDQFFSTENYQAGTIDAIERSVFGGNNAPVIPDFELRVIKPLMANQGMGYYGEWLHEWGNPLDITTFPFDAYRARQIAYGHTGFISNNSFQYPENINDFYRYWVKEFYTFRDFQAQYLASPVREILYQNSSGSLVDLSTALKDGVDFFNPRMKISYQNGLQIYINMSSSVNWVVSVNGTTHYLPPNGWVAVNPSRGFLQYSALVDQNGMPSPMGTRVDFVRSQNYIMADGRGVSTYFGSDFSGSPIVASGLLVIRPNDWRITEDEQGNIIVIPKQRPTPSASVTPPIELRNRQNPRE